jgi:hypothetical protein
MTDYLIRQSAHYASPRTMSMHTGITEMWGKAIFERECWYSKEMYGTHLNKLVGFTSDILGRNSMRIAWRPSAVMHKIDLYIYLHINGQWVRSDRIKDDFIATVDCDKEFDWSLHKMPGIAIADAGQGTVSRQYDVSSGWGYRQSVYFGGIHTAPWDMVVSLSVNTR